MRYVIFEHEIAKSKGYEYSMDQILYIINEIATNKNLFVYLQEPTACPSLDRLAGKLVNPEYDGENITAEFDTYQTPMGSIVKGILEEGCETLQIAINGMGIIDNGTVKDYKIIGAFMISKPKEV